MFDNKEISILKNTIRGLEFKLSLRDKTLDNLIVHHDRLTNKFNALCKHLEIDVTKDAGYRVISTKA